MKIFRNFLYFILALIFILPAFTTSCQLSGPASQETSTGAVSGQWVEGETDLEKLKEQQEGCRSGHYSWRLNPEEVVTEYGHANNELAEYFCKDYELARTAPGGKSSYLTYSFEGGSKIIFDLYRPFGGGKSGIYAVKKYKIN